MAMLAEKKSKQKWSHDPRNKAWSTNTNRFGYQMLTKMGWSAGKGLGATESGSTSHVKVSFKNNNLGVGAKASQEDNWLAHQDDFNDLLAHLNRANSSDGGNEETDSSANNKDMETIARNSRKRVFYQRFIKSKNTSSYSAEDMACIMGQRSKSAPDSPVDLSENEDSDDSCASCPAISDTHDQGMTTITSKQSIQDYFAMKMAELQERRRQESSAGEDMSQDTHCEKDNVEEETLDETIKKKKKKSKKRKLINQDDEEEASKSNETDEDESEKNGETSMNDENPKKKKKKKSKKRKTEEDDEDLGDLEDKREVESSDKDHNQKDTKQISGVESQKKKKKKEKKKRKEVEIESCYELRNLEDKKKTKSQENQESCEKAKKRKRKSKVDKEETSQNSNEASISKKKKKSKIDFINEDEKEIEREKEKDKKQKVKNKKKKEKQKKDAEMKVNKGETKKKKSKKSKVKIGRIKF